MAALGLMLKRLGFRWVIFIGALAYFARYAVFGTVNLPLAVIVTSQALHGFCYACFFAAGFIYVDRLATDDIRHSVQTVYGIIILGLGPVLGGFLLGWLESAFRVDGVWDYSKLWYTLGAIGLGHRSADRRSVPR
jgi:MFS family permease